MTLDSIERIFESFLHYIGAKTAAVLKRSSAVSVSPLPVCSSIEFMAFENPDASPFRR